MSWLHCFWGVGATISPYIMGWAIGSLNNWRMGYGVVSVIQIVISIILFSTLFLWKEKDAPLNNETNIKKEVGFLEVLKIKGVKSLLVAFFCYCAFETTTGIWASSYLVQYRNLTAEMGARMASLFYLGITVGRFLCGFIADKVGDKNLIRIGSITVIIALILIALPIKSEFFALFGLVLAGVGGAPIYPAIIHSTPTNFGAENSQAVIGIQMASAYTGSTFSPLIFGFIARNINISLYPIFLLFFAVLLLVMTENLNYKKRMNK
jgi:fucose permease